MREEHEPIKVDYSDNLTGETRGWTLQDQWTHFDVVDELGAESRVPVELVPQGLRRALLNQVDRLGVWVCWGRREVRGQRAIRQ